MYTTRCHVQKTQTTRTTQTMRIRPRHRPPIPTRTIPVPARLNLQQSSMLRGGGGVGSMKRPNNQSSRQPPTLPRQPNTPPRQIPIPTEHAPPRRVTRPSGTQDYEMKCPWCEESVYIPQNGINCRIFRHGVYKSTKLQVPPHTSKHECDRLAQEGLIVGCGRPFWFDGSEIRVCDYI